jgi:hypothetical protein
MIDATAALTPEQLCSTQWPASFGKDTAWRPVMFMIESPKYQRNNPNFKVLMVLGYDSAALIAKQPLLVDPDLRFLVVPEASMTSEGLVPFLSQFGGLAVDCAVVRGKFDIRRFPAVCTWSLDSVRSYCDRRPLLSV